MENNNKSTKAHPMYCEVDTLLRRIKHDEISYPYGVETALRYIRDNLSGEAVVQKMHKNQ